MNVYILLNTTTRSPELPIAASARGRKLEMETVNVCYREIDAL
jgi:hypothetical protein